MRKKSIAFLCGAGCEGKGQIELPFGAGFKKDILLSKGIASLYEKINGQTGKITNGAIIDARCTNILYQTFSEHKKEKEQLSKKVLKIITEYENYRKSKDTLSEEKQKQIKLDFKELYKKLISDETETEDVTKNDKKLFFENITLCSFSDELFNYLRLPDTYKTEVGKIEKLYFSAYKSIISSLYKKACGGDFENDYIKNAPTQIKEFRTKLEEDLSDWQQKITKQVADSTNLYYSTIREMCKKYDLQGTILTTNYTDFAEKITGLEVAYLHGKLDWFENVKTKKVGALSSFKSDDEIFPFIFIPSGIKPIVSLKQIEQYRIALDIFENCDVLFILGYGINSDDEHIQNFLNERLSKHKKVVLFDYMAVDDTPEKINERHETIKNIFSGETSFEIKMITDVEKHISSGKAKGFELELTDILKNL